LSQRDAALANIIELVSPFEPGRDATRKLLDNQDFVEVHVDVALAIEEQRDTEVRYP